MKVLVIDDNKEITDMLSFYLESLGTYDCKTINDGTEGLKIIKSEDFGVIILDLAMPGFSGIDIINSLKSDNMLVKNNIIVLTASPLNDQDIERLLLGGVRTILKKPISIDELTNAMQQFVHD